MKESVWLKTVFIIAVAASILLLCGCATKEVADEVVTAEGEEAPEDEYEINTEDIESDLDLSELEGIDEELAEVNW